MKIKAYLDKDELELEVYKVQIALFGGPSCLIYNEDRTQQYETQDKKEIKAIQKLIGQKTVKAFVCGNQDPSGKIVLMKVIPRKTAQEYHW